MELLVLSPEEKLLATIGDDLLIHAIQREVLNNEHTLTFTVIGNHKKAIHVKEGNLVAFEDIEGDFQLYEIVLITDIRGDGTEKEAFCEHANVELLDEHIEDVRPTNKTAEYALIQALEGTRWQVGSVGELGLNSTNFYREDPKSAIKKIIDVWGGEVRYRVTIEENIITGRFVDLLTRRGADRGKTYEHGKDLIEVTRGIDITTLKTAIRGYGKGEEIGEGFSRRISFKDVEWSVANGDPIDKPAGQDWIGDENAREIWGRPNADGTKRHRFGRFEDSEEENPALLLKKAYEYLLTVNQPIANYEGKVIDLFRIKGQEYRHEQAVLGDTAAVLDDEIAPAIEVKARIIELQRDLLDPSQDQAVLGHYLPLYSDKDAEIEKVVAIVNDHSGVWDNPTINPSQYPDIKPSKPVVTALGAFETVQLLWDYAYGEYYTQAFEVYASEVQGFTTNPESLVFRGLLNGYNFIGQTNKQYYFRVRSVNFHGTASDFSDEVSATTARIISDDILFGEEIAQELRELSETAGILGSGAIATENMKQEALDSIQGRAEQYSDTQRTDIESTVASALADKAGLAYVNGQFTTLEGGLNGLSGTVTNLNQRVLNQAEALSVAGGRITTVETDIDTVSGTLSATINTLTAVENTISEQQTQISANAEEIALKASQQSVNNLSGSVSAIEGELSVQAGLIALKAESSALTAVDGRVTGVRTDLSTLEVSVSGISSSVSTLQSDLNGVRESASSIDQKADSIITNVTAIDSRLGTAESTITQQANQISAKVDKNGLIAEINLQPGTVKIDADLIDLVGDVYITNGRTYISEAAIGTAAIANAAITRAKLETAIIGTAQIEDAVITNAKIKDISADKINVGVLTGITIRGVTIEGSIFKSQSLDSTMWIEGGDIRLDSTSGRYLNLNPLGMTGFNSVGDILFQANKTWVTSGILGTNTTNVYLAAEGNGEARVVDIAGIPGDGLVDSYRYIAIRASGFYGNYWNINGGINGIHLYARPFTDGELRITLNGTTDQYRDLRVRTLYANSINPNSGQSSSRHLYVRAFSDGEIRVTAVDTTESYIPVRASGFFGAYLDSTATHIYLRPAGDPGEARVTVRGTTNVYQPIRAKEFITDISVRENKTNIEVFEQNTLDTWRNLNAYLYNRKTDKEGARKQFGMMIDELPGVTHSDASDSFRMYGLVSYIALGLKDTVYEVDSLKVDCGFMGKRIDRTEKAIKKLQDEVNKLKGAA